MTKVVVQKDSYPYTEDYEASLLGWVVLEGQIRAIVSEGDGDPVWTVPMERIRLKV